MADPNKWLGLMKWSMKYADGTTPSDMKPMSKEDRDFLDKVLNEGVIDEAERMRQILRILQGEHPNAVFAKPSDEQPADTTVGTPEEIAEYKDGLLDEMLTRIDQIDNAMNFVKMDGLQVLMEVMQSNDRASTRAMAAEVCSVVVQNNPFCQDAAVKMGLLERLCELAKNEDATCQVKALLAISCLVRNHDAAEQRLLSDSCNGLPILVSFLQEKEDLRLQRKSLFFLRYLIRKSPATAAAVHATGVYVPAVASLISSDDVDLCESSLEGLTEFAQISPEYAAVCKHADLALDSKLSQRIQQIDSMDSEEKEFYLEIRNMATELKAILAAA